MVDYMLRVTAADGYVRGFFATTKDTVNDAFTIHQTTPVVTAAFGRTLTAGAMFGAMHANESDLTTIAIKCDGPIGGIVVTADSMLRVKGYVYNNNVESTIKNGKLNVAAAVGGGSVSVIKDIGMKEPCFGMTPLVSGEIAEDLTAYFHQSEQIPSAIALGVLVETDCTVKSAGGFIIQLMPGCSNGIIDALEQNISGLPPVTTLLSMGHTPEDLMDATLGCFGCRITSVNEISYACNCSRDRVRKALMGVGKEELANILKEDGQASLHCHFCNKDYDFTREELSHMIEL